jgi:PAS domain S-box-containing protein
MFPIFFRGQIEMTECHLSRQASMQFFTLRTAFIMSYLSATVTVGTTPTDWYSSDNSFCTLFSSIDRITASFNDLRLSDKRRNSQVSDDDAKFLSLLELLVPILYAVLGFVPFPIIIGVMLRELRHLCRLMTHTDPLYKAEAARPLRKVVTDSHDTHYEPQLKTWDLRLVFVYCLIMALYVGLVAITAYVFRAGLDANKNFENLNIWRFLSGAARPMSIEMIMHMMQAIYLTKKGFTQNISSPAIEILAIEARAKEIDTDYRELIDGGDDAPSVVGANEVIDDILVSSECGENDLPTVDGGMADFHDMYSCGSLMHQLRIFTEFERYVIDEMDQFDGFVNDSYAIHAFHLVISHAMPKMLTVRDELTALITTAASDYRSLATILFVCGIAVSLLAAVLVFIYKSTIDQTFQGAMIVLRRCSPAGIVANENLLNYLLNQEAEGDPVLTTTASIIHNARDAIVCISPQGIIDSVNTSVTQTLGFIPEQLLGQNLQVMVADKDRGEIMRQLEMMVRREAPKQFKETYRMVNDNDEEIPCLVSLMGMTGSDGKTIESFVVMFKDVSTLLAQQEEAEIAKQKSEKLLYEILPRDIVNRLNQGEKDITFVVPSATLMFIDIQKFSAYAASLTPQEIMGNLSLIFSGFDGLLPKYPLITKIKLIGDVYMCGAGLFTPEEEPRNHAEQMVKFALEAIQSLEDTNIRLSASLSVRIGVNTGGPIIAGVLGTDKPVFDIIGDPINVAARLQTTCLPGKVHIPQSTYDLIHDGGEFTVNPKGETFLKGKGKTMTYLVTPPVLGLMDAKDLFLSSSELGMLGSAMGLIAGRSAERRASTPHDARPK